jgi:hypothetical protein
MCLEKELLDISDSEQNFIGFSGSKESVDNDVLAH